MAKKTKEQKIKQFEKKIRKCKDEMKLLETKLLIERNIDELLDILKTKYIRVDIQTTLNACYVYVHYMNINMDQTPFMAPTIKEALEKAVEHHITQHHKDEYNSLDMEVKYLVRRIRAAEKQK